MRDHPISPVTEPLQYRAIGVVRGIYRPESDDQLTRGVVIDSDGNELEAVVLGRMLTLMRRHLDMTTPHLWVVYHRCRESEQLHLQIAGIWEPSTLATAEASEIEAVDAEGSEAQGSADQLPEGDDFFSIRGELIFTKPEANELVVKVRPLPRADGFRPLPFQAQLTAALPREHPTHFVRLEARRHGPLLAVEAVAVIAPMPTRGGKGREGARKGGARPRPAKT